MALRPEARRASRRAGLFMAAVAGYIGIFGWQESSAERRVPSPVMASQIGSMAVHNNFILKVERFQTSLDSPPPPPAPKPLTPAEWAAEQISALDITRWSRVHNCEEPIAGWHVNGSRYGGGLGISRENWAAYGGLKLFGDEAAATEDEQIVIAKRIQFSPPDQHGCQPGGW